jgi:hypothetical protein
MRATMLAVSIYILALWPEASSAGSRLRQVVVTERHQSAVASTQRYRGYFLDVRGLAGRQNLSAIVEALRQQLDIVESLGLSQHVLNFFHEVPIMADDMGCLGRSPDHPAGGPMPIACYGQHVPDLKLMSRDVTIWDSDKSRWTNSDPFALAEDTKAGIVKLRPVVLDPQRPVMLHELLHAYHARLLPLGNENPDVLFYFGRAISEKLYPQDAYLLTNQNEFFAVTASVFLYGKETGPPFSRSNLKEKQPDYYSSLERLFELDPDGLPSSTVGQARSLSQ